MSQGGQTGADGTRRVLFVHDRSTSKTERYAEVPPGREREVMRNVYIDREMLKSMSDGAQFPPGIVEITLRVVDPEELK